MGRRVVLKLALVKAKSYLVVSELQNSVLQPKTILQEDFIKADSRTIWYEGPDVMAIVSGFQIDTIQMILHQGEIWFEYKIWQSLLVHPKKVIRKKFYSSFSFFKPSPWLPRTICWLHWLLTGVLLSRSLHSCY